MANNYANRDLTGTDFSGQNLEGALFRGANLTNCNFTGAFLMYANMRDTIIEGADFTDSYLNFANLKDATGTATWTNATVKMAPKHIPMPDSDNTTEPPPTYRERSELINQLLVQGEVTELTPEDQDVLNAFVNNFIKGTLTGDYGDMPNGREVYTSLCIDYTPTRPISEIITMHMDKETRYSNELDEFVPPVPCSNIVDMDGDGSADIVINK